VIEREIALLELIFIAWKVEFEVTSFQLGPHGEVVSRTEAGHW